MSHTGAILEFATTRHDLPAAARADALRLIADTLATGAAGAASPEALRLLPLVQRWGASSEARALSGARLPAVSAAFFNGFAIHCLEWDAVHEGAVVHAMSVVTAALLAGADRMGGCDPDAFLAALTVGVDVASGLGLAATGPMRFFRPATAGVIGAALALAQLEGVSAADALGFACAFAGGTMQAHVEASIALPLQIARAAQAAVQAVDLAKAGLVAPHDVLEGPFGYSALIEPLDLARYTASLGAVWRISEVSVKPFPSGRASHGALAALQALRDEGVIGLDEVECIDLSAPPLVGRLVGRPYREHAAPSHNRLCLAFLAPLMLRDGRIDPRLDRTVPALARRVTVSVDGNPDLNALSPQRITVRLKDGTAVERAIPANPGSPEAPLSPTQSAAKLDLCRELAPGADPRLFDDPLSYLTDPQ